ncbi:UNVERIFIED_CONTAM: hypothetical protein GTU68_053879 [Idotea baltica]|nr:hypothetical protein [Idotea baltica]
MAPATLCWPTARSAASMLNSLAPQPAGTSLISILAMAAWSTAAPALVPF